MYLTHTTYFSNNTKLHPHITSPNDVSKNELTITRRVLNLHLAVIIAHSDHFRQKDKKRSHKSTACSMTSVCKMRRLFTRVECRISKVNPNYNRPTPRKLTRKLKKRLNYERWTSLHKNAPEEVCRIGMINHSKVVRLISVIIISPCLNWVSGW